MEISRRANIILILTIPFALHSCKEGYLDLNLKRDNSNDINMDLELVPVITNSCSSLDGVFSQKFYYQDILDWSIDGGYQGDGWVATNCQGGFVEFNVDLPERAALTFYTKTYNPGYSNVMPEVYINNTRYELDQLEGEENSNDWIRMKTVALTPDQHVVRIGFPQAATLADYHLDEIIFLK